MFLLSNDNEFSWILNNAFILSDSLGWISDSESDNSESEGGGSGDIGNWGGVSSKSRFCTSLFFSSKILIVSVCFRGVNSYRNDSSDVSGCSSVAICDRISKDDWGGKIGDSARSISSGVSVSIESDGVVNWGVAWSESGNSRKSCSFSLLKIFIISIVSKAFCFDSVSFLFLLLAFEQVLYVKIYP